MYQRSTIRPKKGHCRHGGCSYYGPLIGGKCEAHYWMDRKMASAGRFEEKEIAATEGLSTVMGDLDIVFSQYIRLRDSDENGYVYCFICGRPVYYTEAECMHYVPRIHQNTRYSEDNCHGGCVFCNKDGKDGRHDDYGLKLEEVRPGSVEALEDQAKVLYSYSVSEIKGLIAYYSKEVSAMKKKKPMRI